MISHIKDVETFDKFKNAILSSVDINEEAEVYISSAKAVLMKDNFDDAEMLKETLLSEGHAGLTEYVMESSDDAEDDI